MVFIGLVQVTFALKLFASNAMRFVPVNFGFADASVAELNGGNPFHFTPATITILFSQAFQVTNGIADGDHFNVCDGADDFKGCHFECFL